MKFKSLALTSAVFFASMTSAQAETDIAQLQAEIEALKSQLNSLADTVEQQSASSNNGVSIGGYGELHLNLYNDKAKNNKIDFHRFVLFVNKEFNEKTRFYSELEVEHSLAGDGKPGEVEVEQAYIEHDATDYLQVKTGLFLVPVGILNETHEPDTFYGVERNNVEKNIIPSTWWEAGAGITLKAAEGLTVDLAAHSGLAIPVADGKYKIRDGRQKVANAVANNAAYTARVKYTAVPGLELAATAQYQSDVTQAKTGDDVSASLVEAHAVYQTGGFTAKALYAKWDIENKIETVQAGADVQEGYYVEPAYRYNNVGVYTRLSTWDNTAGDDVDSATRQKEVGVNYWLADTVVIKGDVFTQDTDGGTKDLSGINVGVGYSF